MRIWINFKLALWKRWTRITGAAQAHDRARDLAYIDRRDLCQNHNQLESTITDLRVAVKQRNKELEAAIGRSRERLNELMEDRMRVHRENLMDARQEARKLADENSAINDELELMQNRLAALESPPVEKIGE